MRKMIQKKCFTGLALCLMLTTGSAMADDAYSSFADFLQKSQWDGDIRSYYFSRQFTNPKVPTQGAYSLGGYLGVLTAPIDGFQVRLALYTAQDLDLNSDNLKHVDRTLPGEPVTVLTESYLQYKYHQFMVRAGNQIIDTPWMNPSDSRMIPDAFGGVYASWKPTENWSFIGLRTWDFKSRTASNFTQTNLYNPQNFGGTPIPGLAGMTFPGAQAIATTYKSDHWNAQLWGYQFFDFGKLLYGDARYTFMPSAKIHPFIAVQALREGGDGNNILQQVSTGKADATAIGTQIGVENDRFRVTAAYNKLYTSNGAYNHGEIVSPYTTGYATDPLYTTQMIAGMVEKAPGDAFKIAATLFAFNKQVTLTTSYAQYYTEPYTPNTNETDIDITYSFPKSSRLHGLSLRNRFGVLRGNPANGDFYYDRVMIQYAF